MNAMVINPDLLRRFVPLNSLSKRALEEIATKAQLLSFQPGSVIFRQGDMDSRLFFLLEGQIRCIEEGKSIRDLSAGEEDARYALARSARRLYTAEAISPVSLISLEESIVEDNLCVDQATLYEVYEYDGDEDPGWMWDVLTQPAFRQVPAEYMNAIFERFEKHPCKEGDVIIEQGAVGDYYYLIREGRARITRKPSTGAAQTLAEIGRGEDFGVDALLTGEPRNATVSMLTDGLLMKLSRSDFEQLLGASLVRKVGLQEAGMMLMAGAQAVDVRLEDEFRAGTLRNSINLPLYLLRIKANALLEANKKYLVFCQNGQRSSAAAFLLAQRGYDVCVLDGGIKGVATTTLEP